jgi:hypothetical protein
MRVLPQQPFFDFYSERMAFNDKRINGSIGANRKPDPGQGGLSLPSAVRLASPTRQ